MGSVDGQVAILCPQGDKAVQKLMNSLESQHEYKCTL